MVQSAFRQEPAAISLDDQMSTGGSGGFTSAVRGGKMTFTNERGKIFSLLVYLSIAVLSGLGLIGKVSLLRTLLPVPTRAIELLIALVLALPLLWSVAIRFRKIVAAVFLLTLAGVFLFVFPRIEKMHSQGRGSDQPDCIVAVSHSLAVAQWPYDRSKIWSQNPLSCGPGWVALQAPAVQAAGYRWSLVVCWACAVAAIIGAIGWSSASALLALLALSPGVWLAAANGSDFLTFGIAITALFLVSERLRAFKTVTAVLLGFIAQFRFPTMLVPAFMRKQIGRKGVILASALALACQLIFLFWNTKRFIDDGPLHLFHKLTNSSALSSQPVIVTIEVIVPLVVAIVCGVFFEERSSWRWDLLLFLILIFVVPACLDLGTKYRLYGTISKTLGFWEGGVWICGCLPLAAAMLVTRINMDDKVRRKVDRLPSGERSVG